MVLRQVLKKEIDHDKKNHKGKEIKEIKIEIQYQLKFQDKGIMLFLLIFIGKTSPRKDMIEF